MGGIRESKTRALDQSMRRILIRRFCRGHVPCTIQGPPRERPLALGGIQRDGRGGHPIPLPPHRRQWVGLMLTSPFSPILTIVLSTQDGLHVQRVLDDRPPWRARLGARL
jgi:hypothetical protein